ERRVLECLQELQRHRGRHLHDRRGRAHALLARAVHPALRRRLPDKIEPRPRPVIPRSVYPEQTRGARDKLAERREVEIVTIGDELLLGFTIDTNGAYLARQLAAIGLRVARRTSVGDEPGGI